MRRVLKLAKSFCTCHMELVPRERNQEADWLSRLATAGYETLSEATVVEWVEEEAFWTKEVTRNDVVEREGGSLVTWYHDVLDFLRTGVLPGDSLVANKLQRWNHLYHKSLQGPLLKCVTRKVGLMALKEIYGGIFGSHINARALM
ncbi:hypothetical protein LIER_18636 [Lithospermum erythrorhizon]|uniref:RNase H type-1 domain-containing protein n=1 Tax=Lithospermum erythrorhizon TaxID=34254 RepID=A0AAV3QHI5_LITER